jgi:hypothetical protein
MVDPILSAKLSQAAKTRPRDAKGHFIKAGTDPTTTAATHITTESPLPIIKTPPALPPLSTSPPKMPTVQKSATPVKKVSKTEADINAPLVVINNPFRALLHWLDQIRRKQTTTFDFKVSVPLIALPVFLIVIGGAMQYMFTLGKQTGQTTQLSPTPFVSPAPKPVPISKVGYIRGTYAVLADEISPTTLPLPTNTPVPTHTPSPTPTFTPTPTVTPSPTPLPPSRFVLVDKDDTIFFLVTPTTVSLQKYLNRRVLVTGLYDSTKETITIKKYADIEVLP